MQPSFFTGLLPQTQPLNMTAGEHLEFYDKPLPSDRSNSFWGLNRLGGNHMDGWKKYISEKTVYDALLRDIGPNGQKRWEVGIGKAGQLYSWRGPWGEAVPPQFMSWTDEAWQATGCAGDIQQMSDRLNKLGAGGIGNGFYQAGATSCQYPPASYTFYAPMLARWFDAKDNAYYVLNWKNCPQAPTILKHKVLIYTRCKYLGNGVLEVTSAAFDAGPYSYGRGGIPWGGVRNSTYPNVFVSKPDGSYKFINPMYGQKGDKINYPRSQTDGWLGAAASKNDPNAQAFAFVFGKKFNKKENPGGNAAVGHAGHAIVTIDGKAVINVRDYTVMQSGVNGKLTPGHNYWVNYYLVVGTRNQVIRNARKYGSRGDYYGTLNITEQNAGLTPLYLDGHGLLTRRKRGDAKPACHLYNKPITDSQPLFRISEVPAGGKSMVTIDPYAMSYKTPWTNLLPKADPLYAEYNNRDTVLVHLSQNKKPLHWTLLGFVIPTITITMDKSQYTPVPGISDTDGEQPVLARK